jgi:hypothetical protein
LGDQGKSLILHWSGGQWEVVPHPDPASALQAVLAVSKTDVWFAAQDNGLTERWNGRHVTIVPGVVNGQVQELTGTQPDSIWLLSYSNEQAHLAHWNGSKWSQAEAPVKGRGAGWQDISARSKKDLWAVGDSGTNANTGNVAHWDGYRWHYIKDPIYRRPNSGLDDVLDLGPRDVWTVNYREADHFDGQKWTITPGPAPNPTGLYSHTAIAGVPQGAVYALARAGTSRDSCCVGRGVNGFASTPLCRTASRSSKR